MKAITLTQPWATLVAIGAKRIETRSWSTRYRGPLAIHAGKGLSGMTRRAFLDLCASGKFEEPLLKELKEWECRDFYPLDLFDDLPRGQIIAIVWLIDCFKIDETNQPPEPEYSFGDYTPGRFGWRLENVRRMEPVTAKGALGLWEWKQ